MIFRPMKKPYFTTNNIIFKAMLGIGATATLAMPYTARADGWDNPDVKAALNPYSQPNIHIAEGRAPLDFYGSGDVNNDEVLNAADATAIYSGVKNDRSDVNGDGVTDNLDAQMIEGYLSGSVQYLPGKDWNHLNASQKIDWLKKCIAIDGYHANPNEFFRVCGNYVNQAEISFRGVQDVENTNLVIGKGLSGEHNARFNIPLYYTGTFIKSKTTGISGGHAVAAVLVGTDEAGQYGEDPTDDSHWYFWDPWGSYELGNEWSDDPTAEGRLYPSDSRLRNNADLYQTTKTLQGFHIGTFDFPDNDGNIIFSYGAHGKDGRLIEPNPNAPAPVDPWKNPDVKAALNPYSQPNIHIAEGRGVLDFYGSGDVNNDGDVNQKDVDDLYAGVINDRGDVDGDGQAIMQSDGPMLQDYVDGKIAHLPGKDWNHLNSSQKIDWLKKMIRIDGYHANPHEFFRVCGNYVNQAEISFRGMQDAATSKLVTEKGLSAEHNARFNIPLYNVTTVISDGNGSEVAHAVAAVLVGTDEAGQYGEDPTNDSHWYFWDPWGDAELGNEFSGPDTEGRLFPGDLHLRYNAFIKQDIKTLNYQGFHIATFDFPENDGNVTFSYGAHGKDGKLIEPNPNKPILPPQDTEAPVISVSDWDADFIHGKSIESYVADHPASATDNMDANPAIEYSNSSTQTSAGILTDVNYSITSNVTATDSAGNFSNTSYVISVQDNEAPTGSLSSNNATGEDGENPTDIARGLVQNVADNSIIAVDTTFTQRLIDETDESYNYSVNVGLVDIAQNETNLGNANISIAKPVIVDNEAPVISSTDASANFVYGKSIDDYVADHPASATDNMDESPTVSYQLSSTKTNDGSLTDVNYNITANVTATDDAGNSSSDSYNIFVEDNEAPTGSLSSTDVTGEIGSNPTDIARELVRNVADNSRLPVDTSFTESLISETETKYNYSVNVGLTDVAGNKTNLGDVSLSIAKEFNPITGFDDQYSEITFLPYPNPTSRYFKIDFGSVNKDAVVTVYNSNGYLVLKNGYDDISGEISIYTGTYRQGVYLVAVQVGDVLVTKKLIVN